MSLNLEETIINNNKFLNTSTMLGQIEPSLNTLEKNLKHSFKDTVFLERNTDIYRKELLDLINISINNYGHRSADFKVLDQDKTNVLFAGCSMTFGEGLPEFYSWPHHVIRSIKSTIDNLGSTDILSYPGGSAEKIIRNVFRYIDQIGKPDYIFILLPDFFREFDYDNESASYKIKMMYDLGNDKKITGLEDINVYNLFTEYKLAYEMLDIFCRVMGIKLMAGSWYTHAGSAMKKIFNDFIDFRNENAMEYFKSDSFDEEYYKTFDSRFAVESADNAHPGLIFHLAFADIFLKVFNKND